MEQSHATSELSTEPKAMRIILGDSLCLDGDKHIYMPTIKAHWSSSDHSIEDNLDEEDNEQPHWISKYSVKITLNEQRAALISLLKSIDTQDDPECPTMIYLIESIISEVWKTLKNEANVQNKHDFTLPSDKISLVLMTNTDDKQKAGFPEVDLYWPGEVLDTPFQKPDHIVEVETHWQMTPAIETLKKLEALLSVKGDKRMVHDFFELIVLTVWNEIKGKNT